MAYELNTIYRQAAPYEPGDYDRPLASMLDAGALGCSAWQALTGPMTGCVAISSRWGALDDMAGWMDSMRPRMAPGGDLHSVAVKAALVTRVLLSEVFEAGSQDTQYLAVTRATASAVDTQLLERGTEVGMNAGLSGARFSSFLVAGEWTGQYTAARWADSLDAFVASSAAAKADATWMARASESGYQPISTTFFSLVQRG